MENNRIKWESQTHEYPDTRGGSLMEEKKKILTLDLIKSYTDDLWEQERAENTIHKYQHDLQMLHQWLDGRALSKPVLMQWKKHLTMLYAAASVNSMLAAVNGCLKYAGWRELMVRPLKIQKSIFCDENKEMSKEEYIRLVKTAKKEGNERMALVLQTICATGIRVSELRFITVESVRTGYAKISNKGKLRTIFLPDKLCRLLKPYIKKQRYSTGSVFVTRTGKPLDRSNIWRDMKKLCKNAKIEAEKVFPHNLRHLFARVYYSIEKDISRLADILGHANIGTTRIYIMESGKVHARQMEQMGLVIT